MLRNLELAESKVKLKFIYLEASGAPVNKLDGPLGLDYADGSIDILGDNITAVQHATGHVFSVTGIALHHLVGGFETGIGDFRNG